MLAATARLASSAINATCSPGRTSRHVSTALCAPGIKSARGEPNFTSLILLELRGFSSASVPVGLSFNWPFVRAGVRIEGQASRSRVQAEILPDSLAPQPRGDTRNAGTWPPPPVTLAMSLALQRLHQPTTVPATHNA